MKIKNKITWNKEYFNVNLQKLPYIWANFSEKTSAKNSTGAYVDLKIESRGDSKATIHFGEQNKPESEYSFQFDLEPGINSYLIRISMNQNFYLFNIDFAKISCDSCEVKKFDATDRKLKHLSMMDGEGI